MSERPIDPLIAAAHKDDPWFAQTAGVALLPEVQARGIISAGEWCEPRVLIADPEDGFPRTANFRTCGFCGSMHPDDLRGFIERGEASAAQLADMKYGYPHKVYLDVPSPLAGQTVQVSRDIRCVDRDCTETPGYGSAAGATHAKFYTRHLIGLDADAFQVLAAWLETGTGLRFMQEPDRQGVIWGRRDHG